MEVLAPSICLHGGPHGARGTAPPGTAGTGGAFEREEVFAFRLVQLQRSDQGVQHAVRGAGQVPALYPHVVVDGDAGQHRYLLAAQALDPAVAAVGGQPGLFRGDARPPRAEEVADLGALVELSRPGSDGGSRSTDG
jgi:hypothetical protein